MDFKDYYKILGIAETADAKTIKTAYRKLARKYHPDVNTDNNTEDKFKEVAEAYAVLKNTQKRSEYDELRKYGKGDHSFEPPPGWQSSRQAHPDQEQYTGDFSEFFESVFTQGRGQSQHSFHQKGQDIETDLPLFLEDTLSDKPKTISIDIPYINEHGQRQVTKKTLNVKIPRGTIDGERIRLKGQGAPGMGNGQRGDLYLYIKLVPHPLFDAHGADLNIIVPLTPWEAALGSKITLPTLEGKIQLTISANSQTGRRLRIKGKGLYHHEKRGDLYAVLKVTMPDHISDDEKELWQAMAEKNTYNPRSEWEA